MNKKHIGIFIICIALLVSTIILFKMPKKKEELKTTENIKAMVLEVNNDSLTVEDQNKMIYTFNIQELSAHIGDYLLIEYTGLLDKNKAIQDCIVTNYETVKTSTTTTGLPTEWVDEGLFKNYYELAYKKLQTLSEDERIGQLFLVRYDEQNVINDLKKYHFGGFVFYEKDFKNKTKEEVKDMINTLQKTATIPLLTSVDEEGGKVVRVSSNPNLVAEPFKSSQNLYQNGGYLNITEDTINKSNILYSLGLNLNLAPVVDVSTDPSDYIYERSFGRDTKETSTYAKTVIEASKNTKVSYTLKHFPGYGNNKDTHTGSVTDNRSLDAILNNDIPPFEAGIKAGAEAVLVSHNIVTNIDDVNPASLSPSIHNILRNRLDFSGIIITDDLSMGATSSMDAKSVKALLAGNDILITTDYQNDIADLKSAIETGTISKEHIDRVALRVLAWKYYKGLITDEK